jgi:hypothetical protein
VTLSDSKQKGIMAPNAQRSARYDNDPHPFIIDDSVTKKTTIPTISNQGELSPSCDVGLESEPESTSITGSDIHEVAEVEFYRSASQKSDAVDDDDDDDDDTTISSTSCNSICLSGVPATEGSYLSDIDHIGDISIDTVDSIASSCHVEHCIDTQLEPLVEDSQPLSDSSSKSNAPEDQKKNQGSYMTLRITYLLVTLVIMLADGLQGTSRR